MLCMSGESPVVGPMSRPPRRSSNSPPLDAGGFMTGAGCESSWELVMSPPPRRSRRVSD